MFYNLHSTAHPLAQIQAAMLVPVLGDILLPTATQPSTAAACSCVFHKHRQIGHNLLCHAPVEHMCQWLIQTVA